jgi:F-type H+-transporting ATPase subunit a
VLEVMGTFLRILTLNLRLYWNVSADHVVLGVFTDLVPVLAPIVFYVLGTFVCFMQAFVPTILTMIYIMLATQHEEGEEHNH